MLAMVLPQPAPIGTAPLQLQEVPTPMPGPGEVRLRVSCCAICRTDLHVIEGELPRAKLPIIPGHQIVGEVDTLGPGCCRLNLGQRVGVAWLRHTCSTCRFCLSGRENLCAAQRFTGYHADGGYAQYAIVPEAFAYSLPAGISDLQAAPLLCAGIIGYRALQRCNLQRGTRLALYGFGSSAHVVLQIARYRGCSVYVVSRSPHHCELARSLGAVWAGTQVADLPTCVDSAVVFAPAGELVPPALEKLERGGTLALAGIYMTDIPSLSYERHLFYERDVHSVTANTRADGRALLVEAALVPVVAQTTTYALRDANRALQDLKGDRLNGTGVLVVE